MADSSSWGHSTGRKPTNTAIRTLTTDLLILSNSRQVGFHVWSQRQSGVHRTYIHHTLNPKHLPFVLNGYNRQSSTEKWISRYLLAGIEMGHKNKSPPSPFYGIVCIEVHTIDIMYGHLEQKYKTSLGTVQYFLKATRLQLDNRQKGF